MIQLHQNLSRFATGEQAQDQDGLDERGLSAVLGAFGVVAFPLLIWASNIWVADFAIPIGSYAIPLSLQSLLVVLAALALGPRLAPASIGLYLIMGAIGLPVYAEGNAGLVTLFGRTGGYLTGFFVCAWLVNIFVRRPDGSLRGWWWTLVGTFAGHLMIFLIGVPWLYVVLKADPAFADSATVASVVQNGFVIFIPGMIIKCLIAAIAGYWVAPFAHRRGW